MDKNVEDLRREFTRILHEIEKVQTQEIQPVYEPSKYESCVKIKGQPILPPLMTETKREKCQHWKKRAIEVEEQLAQKRKQKFENSIANLQNDLTWNFRPASAPAPIGFQDSNKNPQLSSKNIQEIIEEPQEKPKRERKSSYTLDEPSPVLLAYLQRFGPDETEAEKSCQNQNCILENYLTDISKAPDILKPGGKENIQPPSENLPENTPKMAENIPKLTQNSQEWSNAGEEKLLSPIKDGPTWALQSPKIVPKLDLTGLEDTEEDPKITANAKTLAQNQQELVENLSKLELEQDRPIPKLAQMDQNLPKLDRNASRMNQYATQMEQSVSKMDQTALRIKQNAAQVTSNENPESKIVQHLSLIDQFTTKMATMEQNEPQNQQLDSRQNSPLKLVSQNVHKLDISGSQSLTQTPEKLDQNNSQATQTPPKLDQNLLNLNRTPPKMDQNSPNTERTPSKLDQNPPKMAQNLSQNAQNTLNLVQNSSKVDQTPPKIDQGPSKMTQTHSNVQENDEIPTKDVTQKVPKFDLNQPKSLNDPLLTERSEPLSSMITVDSSLMNSMSLPSTARSEASTVNTQIEIASNAQVCKDPKTQIEAAVRTLAAEQQKEIQKLMDQQALEREKLRQLFEEQQRQLISSVLSALHGSSTVRTESATTLTNNTLQEQQTEERTESAATLTPHSVPNPRTKSPVIPTVKPRFEPEELILPENYHVPEDAKTPENNMRFEKLTALIKGHLTRRLLKTYKVQNIINSMKDTMNIALQLHREAKQYPTIEDVQLHSRLLQQLQRESHAFHDIFFKYAVQQKMSILKQDREIKMGKSGENLVKKPKRVSAVTMAKIQQKQQIQEMLKNPENSVKLTSDKVLNSPRKMKNSPKRRLNFENTSQSSQISKTSSVTVKSRKTGVRPILHTKPWK